MADIKQIDDGGFAFPCGPDDKAGWSAEAGMTLRDWFAGQALVGMGTWSPEQMQIVQNKAHWAYQMADAMIAARKGGA